MLITRMSENNQSNKVNKKPKDARDDTEKKQPFLKKINIPSDLNDNQPRSTQVWDCDEIGFDPNGR